MALVYVVIRMLYIPRILRKIGALSKNICPSPTPFQKMVAKLEKKLGLTLESDIKGMGHFLFNHSLKIRSF